MPDANDQKPAASRDREDGHEPSGGEQQMLASGRALMGFPMCLLLDGPFEGLAPVIMAMLALTP